MYVNIFLLMVNFLFGCFFVVVWVLMMFNLFSVFSAEGKVKTRSTCSGMELVILEPGLQQVNGRIFPRGDGRACSVPSPLRKSHDLYLSTSAIQQLRMSFIGAS